MSRPRTGATIGSLRAAEAVADRAGRGARRLTAAGLLLLCTAALSLVAGYRAAAAPAQDDAEQRFVDAESAFAGGDAGAALRLLDALIEDYPRGRYPDNPWRIAARVRAGEIELALGRIERAGARFVGVIDSEPATAWTSRARVGLASTLLWQRNWAAAATLLQQVVDAFVADAASGDALAGTVAAERLTLLHRVWLRPAAGEMPWQRTLSLDLGATLDDPIGVAVGANGVLVSDEGTDAVVFRDSTGNAASFALRDGYRPWWSPRGEAYVAARAAVNAPLSGPSSTFTYDDRGRQRAVEDIRAGATTADGGWLLLDDDVRGVLRFDPGGGFLGALELRGGEAVDVDVGPDGRIFVIEKDRREIMVFDAGGALQGAFAIDGWREPYALALDDIGHVYVLDRRLGRIDVFDPDGGILWTLGPNLPGGVELDDPRDIAVDGRGRILVADRSLGVVVVIE